MKALLETVRDENANAMKMTQADIHALRRDFLVFARILFSFLAVYCLLSFLIVVLLSAQFQ